MEQTSTTQVAAPSTNWGNTLFGFRGSIGRGRYLMGLVIGLLLFSLALVAFAQAMMPTGGNGDMAIFAPPLALVFIWIHLAITVKRLRDSGGATWLGILVGLGPAIWIALTLELIEVLPALLPLGLIALLAFPAILPSRSGINAAPAGAS